MLDPAQFSSDLDNMLDDWDEATYTPKAFAHPSANTVALTGLFDFTYVEINGVMDNRPTFLTKTANVSTVAVDDNFTIGAAVLDTSLDGASYKIKEFQRNGNDTTLLILEAI